MEMAARPAVFATWMTLIEGIYRLLLSDEHLPVNIGNPAEISILHFAEVINQMVGNKAGILFEPTKRLVMIHNAANRISPGPVKFCTGSQQRILKLV